MSTTKILPVENRFFYEDTLFLNILEISSRFSQASGKREVVRTGMALELISD